MYITLRMPMDLVLSMKRFWGNIIMHEDFNETADSYSHKNL